MISIITSKQTTTCNNQSIKIITTNGKPILLDCTLFLASFRFVIALEPLTSSFVSKHHKTQSVRAQL